ncbi:heterokaryon incompatibility protein-domain-containing protein, partial [Pyrenochaeta sp. MPI-SDFR-AT-0127]
MDADHYKYSPISSLGQHPEIRIVDLEPGLEHDTIKIQLRQCQLIDSMGSYVALSYTWGNALKTHSARVSSKTLGITQNLHSALVRLRLADKPRSLWIDAICINQEDSTEKSQQIPLMPRIYSSSSSTVVWLGEDSEDL